MANNDLQINIGLFASGLPAGDKQANDAAMWQRLRHVYLWAEQYGPTVQRRLICPADEATEPTVIVAIPWVSADSTEIVLDLWRLCDDLQQDCVAVSLHGHGELVGPNSAAWGSFDASKFHYIGA